VKGAGKLEPPGLRTPPTIQPERSLMYSGECRRHLFWRNQVARLIISSEGIGPKIPINNDNLICDSHGLNCSLLGIRDHCLLGVPTTSSYSFMTTWIKTKRASF
jgi:hypothetical protein